MNLKRACQIYLIDPSKARFGWDQLEIAENKLLQIVCSQLYLQPSQPIFTGHNVK